MRKVQSDCAVEVDTNSDSVPWRLIGESVQVTVSGGRVQAHHAGRLVAEHAEATGRRLRIGERSHFAGVATPGTGSGGPDAAVVPAPLPAAPELLRCLSEYEAVAGGGW